MGSLMAGWDSHVSDPKEEKFRRNKSLTKDEIDAFWKLKKLKEDEHLKDISLLSPRSQVSALKEAIGRDGETSPSETSLEKLILQKHGWWIGSNWAFLNEPPVMGTEGSNKRYAAQFHVADMATGSNTGGHGQSQGLAGISE